MKPIKANFKYDYDTDTYSVVPKKREYDSSFQLGDLVFDVDKQNNIVGVEILNVSRILRIPKAFLQNQITGEMLIEISEEYLKLHLTIKSIVRNSRKTSTLSVERIKPDFMEPAELNFAIA
jgi:uncharacterized protein YuzE